MHEQMTEYRVGTGVDCKLFITTDVIIAFLKSCCYGYSWIIKSRESY